MSSVYIVTDTRERDVKGILNTLADAANIPCLEAQINTGDFLICQRRPGEEKPRILAVIERKTLKDFGDSFKDGRYENRRKMIERREAEGCALYFVVEGPAFPAATRKFSRIPYANIEAAMLKMQVRDAISSIKTENVGGTADLIVKLARTFAVIDDSPEGLYKWPHSETREPLVSAGNPSGPRDSAASTGTDSSGGGAAGDEKGKEPVGAEGAGAPAGEITGGAAEALPTPVVPDVVLGVKAKPPGIIAGEMWAKLRGISIPTGNIIAQHFSVLDVIGGADISAVRNPSGRLLSKDGRSSLGAMSGGARDAVVRVLAGITGISPAIAQQVYDQVKIKASDNAPSGQAPTFAGFFAGRDPERAVADLTTVQIQQSTRTIKLGRAKAQKIYEMLAWSGNA